jgi:putative tryptophan/tyrosine transport system substrate-binding protein
MHGDGAARTQRVLGAWEKLRRSGWTDGGNMRLDLRWYGDGANQIWALAQELVGLQPDIILAASTPVAVAVERESTIPIVFANVGDPVANGIVARLDRPSANIIGFGILEPSLGGRWLELLSEIAPGLKRAAIMFNPDNASVYLVPSFETAARSLLVAPLIAPVREDGEIETVISTLGREPGGGLVVMPDGFTRAHRAPIILAAARNKVPAAI